MDDGHGVGLGMGGEGGRDRLGRDRLGRRRIDGDHRNPGTPGDGGEAVAVDPVPYDHGAAPGPHRGRQGELVGGRSRPRHDRDLVPLRIAGHRQQLAAHAPLERRELGLTVAEVDDARRALDALGRERRARIEQHGGAQRPGRAVAVGIEAAQLLRRDHPVGLRSVKRTHRDRIGRDADDGRNARAARRRHLLGRLGHDADAAQVVATGGTHRCDHLEQPGAGLEAGHHGAVGRGGGQIGPVGVGEPHIDGALLHPSGRGGRGARDRHGRQASTPAPRRRSRLVPTTLFAITNETALPR
ncbi:MAG TPA: hypothetical protein VGL44_01790 [Gaiellales bacterium]